MTFQRYARTLKPNASASSLTHFPNPFESGTCISCSVCLGRASLVAPLHLLPYTSMRRRAWRCWTELRKPLELRKPGSALCTYALGGTTTTIRTTHITHTTHTIRTRHTRIIRLRHLHLHRRRQSISGRSSCVLYVPAMYRLA